MKTKTLMYCVLAYVALNATIYAQETFVNRVFQDESGSPLFNPILNPFGVQWSNSIVNNSGDLIMVGYTTVSGQGQNIYLIKYDVDGNIVWQTTYNTSGSNNDYGIGLYETNNNDILVCGTTDNGGSNYDVVVLRYNSTGSLLYSAIENGPANLDDVSVSIAEDGATNIIVAANTQAQNSFSDYWALKFDPTLSLITTNTYDYAGLNDIALGVEFSGAGDVVIIGASASGTAACDYALAIFSSNLSFLSDTRNNIPGTALDQALAFCKDASNNTYITGKAWNGTDFDIKTIKITPTYSIAWTATLDVNGLDDAATTIGIDLSNGNVVIGGFTTRTGNITDMISVRYNSSSGASISSFTQPSENNSGNSAIKKLCLNTAGDVYFVGAEIGNTGFTQVVVGKLSASGLTDWQKKIIDLTQNIFPSDIELTSNEVFVISILDSITDSYLTTGYKELTLDTAKSYSGGKPCFKKRELVVSFLPGTINKAAIDNQVGTAITEFGDLRDFLTTGAYNTLNAAFADVCRDCDIKAIKIYTGLKTTDTMGISRLGINVQIPSFWSTLLLQMPNTISIQQTQTVLRTLSGIVSYCHPNPFIQFLNPPNDPLYSSQKSLHPVGALTNAHINVEDAWNVVQSCGLPFVKAGVFDLGVHWKHQDFGYTGSATSGKVQGWHFGYGQNAGSGGANIRHVTVSFPDPTGHGSAVAGIIGAVSNNSTGVSGIAGGDGSSNNPGVSIFSLKTGSGMFWLLDALFETSRGGTNKPYSYGLHLSNHSYAIDVNHLQPDSVQAYIDQVRFANRMQVTWLASRGNSGSNNVSVPATLDTNWVISVGGSDSTGNREIGSSYGSGVDVMAPSTPNLIRTTWNSNTTYNSFSGTSAAAPHASGVAALLMSYMNDSVANYKNLAPEDCDYIIQRSATNLGPNGYDSLTGFGRLNAGNALRMVEKPFRILYHYGTNAMTPHVITKTVHSSLDTIWLTEPYQNYSIPAVTFPKGKYFVKTFKIDASFSHNATFASDSLMHFWPRHSSSHVYSLFNAQKRLNMHEKVKINTCSASGATLTGYVYKVTDSLGNSGWWPCDTSFAALTTKGLSLMEYSVLTKNKAVGISELDRESNKVTVFPNPASNVQTLLIQNENEAQITVEIYDMTGRNIKTLFVGKGEKGLTRINHNVAGLANSMYIYIIKIGDEILTKKFLKE